MEPQEMIALFFARSEKAIEAAQQEYGSLCRGIARNLLGSEEDVEECLNDTYLGAWNSMPPNKPTLLHVFLSKITRNISLGRLRKRTAEKRIPPELILSLEELDDGMCFDIGEDEKHLIRQLSYILNDYLATLSDRHVFVFVCRYYYSDSIESIAKMLGLSANTISRDLSKIRAGLRERLA